jgi:hypothetical protein
MFATLPTTRLEVAHDGIRANARVIHGSSACELDRVLDAALQSDAETAAAYRDVLRAVAPRLYVVIRKEIDGDSFCGCCWFGIALVEGINGDTLTRRTHRLTGKTFRGQNPSAAEIRAEEIAILRRCAAIGLASAEHHFAGAAGEESARTVAEYLARRWRVIPREICRPHTR